MQLSRAVNPSPIKSIQRGVVAMGSSAAVDVTVSAVNMSKAMINLLGVRVADATLDKVNFTISLTTSTNINFQRYVPGSSAWVSWELIEYA